MLDDPRLTMELTFTEEIDGDVTTLCVKMEPVGAMGVIGALETAMRRFELIGPNDRLSLWESDGEGAIERTTEEP